MGDEGTDIQGTRNRALPEFAIRLAVRVGGHNGKAGAWGWAVQDVT